jgi:hypothetical protein
MLATRRHLGAPTAAAILACFLVVGGVAEAKKKKAPKNSVVTKSIKNNAVKAAKIATGAVTGEKIADGTVTLAKLALDAKPRVVAFTRVNDPPGSDDPSLTSPFRVSAVAELLPPGSSGATLVTVAPEALPGGSVAGCTIVATMFSDAPANSNASLGFPGFTTVAIGGNIAANQIQVQTRNAINELADRSYYLAVACDPGA